LDIGAFRTFSKNEAEDLRERCLATKADIDRRVREAII
jgi:hypothetical protein